MQAKKARKNWSILFIAKDLYLRPNSAYSNLRTRVRWDAHTDCSLFNASMKRANAVL